VILWSWVWCDMSTSDIASGEAMTNQALAESANAAIAYCSSESMRAITTKEIAAVSFPNTETADAQAPPAMARDPRELGID